jgi:transglutaminase-like putative cysteine protease
MGSANIEKLLQIGIAAIIVFATIMLGVGEQSIVLTLCTLVAVAVSAYVTDVKKTFVLSQNLANALALAVVFLAAVNMLLTDREGQIGAVASLQSYMQYVLLFQPKSARVYWQLALLSLGQVAIAATLVAGPLFGAMLLVYLTLGIVTFTLLLLHTEAEKYASPDASTLSAPGPSLNRTLTLTPSVAVSHRPLARGLIEQSLGILAMTFAVTMVLFFIIPRAESGNRQTSSDEALRTVGYSSTITLGELGEVVQNPDVVMRIEFYLGRSSKPFKLAEEPLFRGAAVSHYQNGAWVNDGGGFKIPLPVRNPSSFVRQRISVESLESNDLFCVLPVFGLRSEPQLRLSGTGQLVRHEEYEGRQMEFEVGTTGIFHGRLRKFTPAERFTNRARARLLQMPEPLADGTDPLAGLKETAAAVLRDRGVDPANQLAAALALQNHLRQSGEYVYSLEPQDRGSYVDPLEDFVNTHRAGHCEYFAGALAMMLRSQGIPARVAIGFKGGEWNSVGGYYQVQQLHAHAWVEAYLPRDQAPADALSVEDEPAEAVWLTLDPTASTTDEAGRVGLWARVRQSVDYARMLWSNYVVGLNYKRQQQGIYEPLQTAARAGMESVFSGEAWSQRGRAIARSPLGTFWEWYRKHWFSWRGGIVAAGASALLVATYFAIRWLTRMAIAWRLRRQATGRYEPPPLEMYRRLEVALARQGLERQAAQTAYEFAVAAGGHLAESIELNRLAHLPRRVVESFYRVRFGRRTLDNHELDAVEHALRELERAQPRKPR